MAEPAMAEQAQVTGDTATDPVAANLSAASKGEDALTKRPRRTRSAGFGKHGVTVKLQPARSPSTTAIVVDNFDAELDAK